MTFEVETTVPTRYGALRFRAYRDDATGSEHLAIIAGEPSPHGSVVRIHSECLTGEVFGSHKCECGPQLDVALELIAESGGVVIYMRATRGGASVSSRNSGPTACRRPGLDTLDANIALGLPGDARNYAPRRRFLPT